MSKQLSIVLPTTLALLDRLQSTLITTPPAPPTSSSLTTKDNDNDNDNALPLLSASSTALRSQITKLSLLTITSPLTESAICTVLCALNESVLPSLVTASLLITPAGYTKAFHDEVRVLARTALREVIVLVGEVKGVVELKEKEKKDKKGGGGGGKERELSKAEKDVVMVATGRVWDACDVLVDVAAKGVVGFVVRRVEEWRDLVRDAVREVEEWDPDEEEDEFFDELLSDDGEKEEGEGDDDDNDDDDEDEDSAELHEQKKTTLRVLKPIAQIYPAILTNRLKNTGNNIPATSPAGISKLESLMANLQSIPDNIDEVAGALYEDNLDKSTQYLRKVKNSAAKAVDLVALPWETVKSSDGQQDTGDKFTSWSKTWAKVMDEVSRSISINGTPKSG